MTTFFTSDLHFGHFNIIGYSARPFVDVDEMNAALIENWNATVADGDIVWILGDIALGKIAETLPLVGELHGTKILVPGNHDRCWLGHKKVGNWRERYIDAGIHRIFEGPLPQRLNGEVESTLCHFPYAGDSHDTDRFVTHRPKDDGYLLLHGHVHEAWKVAHSPKGTLMVNVGVDVWDYRPVAVDAIMELVASTD